MSGVHRVFVYGSLRAGQYNDINRLAPAPILLAAEAWVPGVLYDLGAYPGLVLDLEHGAPVHGEVYEIDDVLLAQLDEIEEIVSSADSEYQRKQVEVCSDHGRFRCWVYEINPACLAGRSQVPSGDWCLAMKVRS